MIILTMRLFVVLLLIATVVRADVMPAALFTDGVVLQRDKRMPVWGRADAGEKIAVSFRGQAVFATAGRDGRWIVYLDPAPLSATATEMTISGKNLVTVHDVVVGDVWLASGQSNMEFPVARAANAENEMAAAHFPLLRQVKIERTVAEAPAEDVKTGGWQAATPATVGGFSAVAYFFARDLHQKLGVPIGIINSSWGGTPIESWMSPAALTSDPAFGVAWARWQKTVADYPAAKSAYEAKLTEWTAAEAAAKTKGPAAHTEWLRKNPRPRAPRGPGDAWTPTGLFNGMINPLLPCALRGAIWYQGESNADRAAEYRALFTTMITTWRAHFAQGDFPFYWVNLANFKVAGDPTGMSWAFLREAQTQTLALPNTGQAITIDIGNPDDIHPTNKQEVGRRLAFLAKRRVYELVVDDVGPTFESFNTEPAGASTSAGQAPGSRPARSTSSGQALRVRFANAGTGLIARDKPVQSLELAGADHVFRPASGKIDRDTLIVSSPEVKQPVAVRYAWRNAPEANLYNGAGLPAVPFRSDDW